MRRHNVEASSRPAASRILLALAAVALLGTSAWILYLQRRADGDEQAIAELRGRLLRLGSETPRTGEPSQDRSSQAAASETGEASAPAVAPATASSASLLAEKYAASPGLQRSMTEARRVQLELKYTALLDRWNLTPAERQEFFQVLLDSAEAETELNMSLLAASPAERTRLAAEIRDLQDETDSRIQTVIGPERSAEYATFNEDYPIRALVENLATRLAVTSEPLSQAQSAALRDALSIARQKTEALSPPGIDSNTPLTPEAGQALLKSMELANDIAATDAASVLSATQLEAFRRIQTERMAATQRGLELLK